MIFFSIDSLDWAVACAMCVLVAAEKLF